MGTLGTWAGIPMRLKRHGVLTALHRGTQTTWLAFPDARTLLVTSRAPGGRAWLRARVAGMRAGRGAPASLRTLGRAAQVAGATLWLLVGDQRWAWDRADVGLPPPRQAALVLRAARDLQMRAWIEFRNETAARKGEAVLSAKAKKLQQDAYVRMLLSHLRVTRTRQRLTVEAAADESATRLLGQAIAAALLHVNWSELGKKSGK